MKNITVSVSDETYRAVRIAAAEEDTTVTALVRDYLQALSARGGDFKRLEGLQNDAIERIGRSQLRELARRERRRVIEQIRARHPGFSAADRIPRDELYERGLR